MIHIRQKMVKEARGKNKLPTEGEEEDLHLITPQKHAKKKRMEKTFNKDFLTFNNGLVASPCSPRDSQESSAIPQFKSINSSALSLLHSPNFTSIHDYRKIHSLD